MSNPNASDVLLSIYPRKKLANNVLALGQYLHASVRHIWEAAIVVRWDGGLMQVAFAKKHKDSFLVLFWNNGYDGKYNEKYCYAIYNNSFKKVKTYRKAYFDVEKNEIIKN